MDATSDKRFDPHRAAQLLLELAHEQALEPLLRKIVEHGAERTEYVFTQVWLIESGDRCATCKYRSVCADQSRCLHLVAAKGSSLLPEGKGLREFEDLQARVPLNLGPLGEAVAGAQQGLLTKSDPQPIAIPGFDWLRAEGVRGYALSPIRFKGEVLGALVGFTRDYVPETSRPWVAIFADQMGAAIANARAFEDLRVAGKRLEQANQELGRELAERKEAEQQVALLSFALDKGHEAAFLIDDTARFQYVNEEACRLLGYTRAELLGLGIADIDSEFPLEGWAEQWRHLQGQRSRTFESRHQTRDGRLVPVEVSVNYFEYGGRAYHLALVRDITERKRAEEALRESETRFRTLLDHAADALFIFDSEQGTIVDVNRQACESLGYTRQELIGTTGVAFHLDSEQTELESVAHRAGAGETVCDKHWHRRKDGTLFPVEVQTSLVSYGDRRFLLKVARDISDRLRAEEALRRSAAYLAEAQRLTHTGCWAWDPRQDQMLHCSEEIFRIYGVEPPGRTPTFEELMQRVHPEDRDRVRERTLARIREKVEHFLDYRIVLPDGTLKYIQSVRRPVLNEAGEVVEVVGTSVDVTERKRAEEEVRNAAAQWQATFDAVQDLVLLLDKDSRILRANRAAAEFLGLPFDQIVGRPCHQLFHGTSTSPAECPFAAMCQTRRHEEAEVLVRKGGPWLSVSVAPLFAPSGELAQVVHVARDITERKRAEDELRRKETYLTEGQRLSHTGSWAWNPATLQVLYWSEEMFRIFGLDPQDGVPTAETFWQRIHPEDLERTRELLLKTAAGILEYEHEHRIVLPDGTVKHIHASGHPVLDENGQVAEYVGTAMDVTERKRAEDELRKHRENLEEMVKHRTEQLAVLNQLVYGSLEAAEVAAWWIDFKEPDTYHALDNAARMLGLEPDPTGKKSYKLNVWSQLLADTARAFPEYAALVEATKERLAGTVSGKYKNYRAIYPVAMPDGSLKWMDARAEIAKRDAQGHALLMTGTLIDITRLKRTEADLEEARARAEAANRAKSTFLANMSHELRTPLNAVLGFSRLLKSGPDVTPRQQETLDIIVRSGEHLLNLINNVLDMAKIESGRMVLEESEVDVHRLLHELQSLMGVGATEKGLRFSVEPAPDLPRFVAVDAGKLRQVLLNLVGNAIKYTESGWVKLRARLTCSAEGGGRSAKCAERAQVRFEVEDSGPGLSQEDRQRIFVPFVQVGGQAPAQTGTGLGLAICKQYVELMGGQVGVASEPGKGSVFYFTIPVRVLPSVAEPEEPQRGRIVGLAEGQPAYRLLIVEDQPENRLLLRRMLDPLGFELREAVHGQEAVALFEEWHPDLIWMDIRMPVMDGLEAVRRIRATQAGASTKIIALTAHALEEERRTIMAAGFDELVRKPFREQEVFDALGRHLRLKFIYEKAPRQESTPERPGLVLGPEQLHALPAELLQELRQAVLELDTTRTQALIEQVTERDAALGRALNTLAAQLDYQRLLKLLEREHS